jgi:CBS domain containing-hemolysin-like protein
MTSTTLLWLSLAALAVASFAALGVHVLREFSRSQLRELLRQRNLPKRYDVILEKHQRAALGAESLRVLATAAAVVAAMASLWQTLATETDWTHSLTIIAGYLVVGILLLWLAIVWLPLSVGRILADRILARTWPIWRTIGTLTVPSMLGARAVEQIVFRISGQRPQPQTEEELEEEIREVVTEGQREGLLEEDAREMIESVITLGEVHVSEIMTPRTDMVSLPLDLPWQEALELVVSSGHTRYPVYGKSHDDVVGILHIKEMFHELVHKSPTAHRPIAELMRPPFFVPETKHVDDLLQEFQRSHNHIAVVMDEFGGVSGVVTIEDVLEEIVGEIADEHDDATIDGLKPIDDHSCEALAGMHLSEINQRMGLHLPDDEHFDTIGGFVFHQLGRIPHAGEEVVYDGIKIKVLDATRRRIKRIAIEILPPQKSAEESDSQSEEPNADKM